ncbi:MAG: hypothetical protein ACLQVN_20555, partial [Bryobacteraceae bacterium]
ALIGVERRIARCSPAQRLMPRMPVVSQAEDRITWNHFLFVTLLLRLLSRLIEAAFRNLQPFPLSDPVAAAPSGRRVGAESRNCSWASWFALQ